MTLLRDPLARIYGVSSGNLPARFGPFGTLAEKRGRWAGKRLESAYLMAFGFGFNKQKVLSAAEKFVQQGKLQNAIAEYEMS